MSERIDEIRAAHEAVTVPGPWFWHGNTDNHHVGIAGRVPGLGVTEVLTTMLVDHKDTDHDVRQIINSMLECEIEPEGYVGPRFDENGDEHLDYLRAIHEAAVAEHVFDAHGNTRSTPRLAVGDDGMLHDVEKLAVYEVARNQRLPEDTPREHPKVYRADICDVRSPDARFLAGSWQMVADLLATIERVESVLDAWQAEVDEDAASDSTARKDLAVMARDRIAPLRKALEDPEP